MKQLHFYYRMSSLFSAPITDHSFTLKCIPSSESTQDVMIFYKRIAAGKVSGDWTASGKDAAGNQYIYGRISAPHTAFSVEVEGTAWVSSGAGYKKEAAREMLYRFPTALTICTEEMERFLMNFWKRWPEMKEAALMPSKLRAEQQSLSFRKSMKNLMEAVFCHMEYVPSATTVTTTAGSAFAMKKGVCQDYAHIMIAFCRRMGIPAAYVAGYMMGEGASHAWVSVCDQSTGTWYEIDPTNDRWVDDDYIYQCAGSGDFSAGSCPLEKCEKG